MIYHAEEEDGVIFEIPRVRQTLAEQALSSTRNHLRSISVDKLELVHSLSGLQQLVRIDTMCPNLSALSNKASL
jgi:hypothetical protein